MNKDALWEQHRLLLRDARHARNKKEFKRLSRKIYKKLKEIRKTF